ncbi:siderophore-interacting protein [Agilicoccus flavus]|uniref:siderophore-interacting protein n=1 Tax=Agilicoccus flavus TaxID=2775968 RepID=UPI001CF68BB1|nr:siderophore-interacting protein [Agilicoccus flavus]
MSITPPPRPPQRRPAGNAPKRAVVQEVADLTPRMRRVTLRSDELVGVDPVSPDQRVKLVFPEGRVFGDDPTEMGRARRRRRTYTLLDLDAVTGTAAVDFVLHGTGLAGEWAAGVRPGDEVGIVGPVGRYEVDPDADLLVVTDETGLPAARAVLAELPAGRWARVHVEVADDAERQELASAADVELTWWPRGDAGPGEPMARVVDHLGDVGPDTKAWVAGEAAAVLAVRAHLLGTVGLPRAQVDAVAYWTLGRTEA